MLKRIYSIATLLIVCGLLSIFLVSFNTTRNLDQLGNQESEHVRMDIVLATKSLINDELSNLQSSMLLSNLIGSDQSDEDARLEELLLFSDSFLDVLLVDEVLALSMLSEMLNEDEILLLETILAQAFSEQSDLIGNTVTLQGGGGYAKLRLYVHASWGWFSGQLSTTLLTIAITPVVIQIAGLGTAAGGPVGLVVGALIGATLGVAIERYINYLVYRNGQAGFTFDLINTTIVEGWLIPFKINIEFNLLDIIFSIINFSGGKWSASTAGAPRPQSLPRFSYA